MLAGAVVAFLLGCFVTYRWKPTSARWVWMVGACGFLWHWVEHLASSDVISDRIRDEDVGDSRACVGSELRRYSVGALLISEMLRGRETEK